MHLISGRYWLETEYCSNTTQAYDIVAQKTTPKSEDIVRSPSTRFIDNNSKKKDRCYTSKSIQPIKYGFPFKI